MTTETSPDHLWSRRTFASRAAWVELASSLGAGTVAFFRFLYRRAPSIHPPRSVRACLRTTGRAP